MHLIFPELWLQLGAYLVDTRGRQLIKDDVALSPQNGG